MGLYAPLDIGYCSWYYLVQLYKKEEKIEKKRTMTPFERSRSRNEIHQFVSFSFVGTPIYSGLNNIPSCNSNRYDDDGPKASQEASSSAVSSC